MRFILSALAALALSACGQQHAEEAPSTTAEGCVRSATHEVTWSNATSPDVITTTSSGPTCLQAVVTFVVRNSDGDPLWVHASTHYDMSIGGIAPLNAEPVTAEQMDTFLAGWANVTEIRSSELREWRPSAASLDASVDGLTYNTPYDRETYEMMRARDLPTLCFAAASDATHCMIVDPISGGPTIIVMFGP